MSAAPAQWTRDGPAQDRLTPLRQPLSRRAGIWAPAPKAPPAMLTIELERSLVKSAPELWDDLTSETRRIGWLGEVRVSAACPPYRLGREAGGGRGGGEPGAGGGGARGRGETAIGPMA